EHGQTTGYQFVEQGTHRKVGGQPGAGRKDHQVGGPPVQQGRGEVVADGGGLGTVAAHVVGKGVDEGVLVVDEQDLHVPSRQIGGVAFLLGDRVRVHLLSPVFPEFEGFQQGTCLEEGLSFLGLGVG